MQQADTTVVRRCVIKFNSYVRSLYVRSWLLFVFLAAADAAATDRRPRTAAAAAAAEMQRFVSLSGAEKEMCFYAHPPPPSVQS